ncbi:MAG TPA: arginine repressor [Bacteroidota bacterium]|nr:arginine repressor [Bacteroidota bacterium]
MTKQARLFAIREIIATKQIGSQDGLRRELKKRGCTVTQATLSRDMKELGVSRIVSAAGGQYAMQTSVEVQALRPLVNAEVLSIDANEGLIVVHTLPGCANTVGEFIDVQKHPDVIGTVAGDNTLLIIPGSQRRTQHVLQFLKNKLIEGQE